MNKEKISNANFAPVVIQILPKVKYKYNQLLYYSSTKKTLKPVVSELPW